MCREGVISNEVATDQAELHADLLQELDRLRQFTNCVHEYVAACSSRPRRRDVWTASVETYIDTIQSAGSPRKIGAARLASRVCIIAHYAPCLSTRMRGVIAQLGELSAETVLQAIAILAMFLLESIPWSDLRKQYPRQSVRLAIKMRKQLEHNLGLQEDA